MKKGFDGSWIERGMEGEGGHMPVRICGRPNSIKSVQLRWNDTVEDDDTNAGEFYGVQG